jgi:hypothetical protein
VCICFPCYFFVSDYLSVFLFFWFSIYLHLYLSLLSRCTRVHAQFSDSLEASAIHGLPHTHTHTHTHTQTHTYRRCAHEGCDHRRVYGPPPGIVTNSLTPTRRDGDGGGCWPGERGGGDRTRPLFCFRHKRAGDIDLVHKTCMYIEGKICLGFRV